MPTILVASESPSGSVTPAMETVTNLWFGGHNSMGVASATLHTGGRLQAGFSSSWAPLLQSPAWQASFVVQTSPSLHAVPLDAGGFEHAPVDGLHVPVTWHWSLGVQTTGFDPVQTPPWQASFLVQALPSLQGAVLLTCTQVALGVPAFWHASSVHGLSSPQSVFDWQPPHTFGPPTHAPAEQVSGPVQALPSLQGAVLLT
jgi:hypothetical protein